MHNNPTITKQGTLLRIFKTLFSFYPVMMPVVVCCILFSAIISSIPSVFMQKVIAVIEANWQSGDWAAASGQVMGLVGVLVVLYVLALLSAFTYTRMMAIITQGFLKKLRVKMFSSMQDLPIRYFDTNNHGDIMSYYTNDIDTLRQLVSQSFPQITITLVTMTSVTCIMLYYSLWMTLVVVAGVAVMAWLTKKVGGNSARFFLRQQEAIGAMEGYVEEMMNGQKVVKVFCHEEESKADFDKRNDELFRAAESANKFANILMPVNANLGNISYVLCAVAGAALALNSWGGLTLGALVSFLTLNKNFTQPVTQISQQLNSVVMAMAGAQRVFDLMDQQPEEDKGYVTLVNAKENADGTLTECAERTGLWAWKHPHHDGTLTYTRLQGNVVFNHVDFGYDERKLVLHEIDLFATPGQKIAFVGSTGAGKTTITNLINRFYDIADGKIRYDGININKIKKSDLRRSLGMVLQDTHLFTGTVMENIRYGRLDASDEECVAAAKLAGADRFIRHLPEGYNTLLTGDGANLSQGQRQLLAIARAAVADPPVLILDEATSSIDTRTEALVQQGMDALMTGRTTFVIAHRLSTVKNADCIMVLEQGRIIERGTHDQLIAQKGRYYQLYTGNAIGA